MQQKNEIGLRAVADGAARSITYSLSGWHARVAGGPS